MPYIAAQDRLALDGAIEVLADDLVARLTKVMNGDTDVSLCYKDAFVAIADALRDLEGGKTPEHGASEDEAVHLAHEIFDLVERRYDYRGAWLGCLNYSITKLIQLVPAKLVERKAWKDELRYWVHAQTVGALQNAATRISLMQAGGDGHYGEGGDADENRQDWVIDGLVGVLIDVKDEYKRRVNCAYEAVQIRKNGDCYTTPYRTELVDIKDEKGDLVGYQEIMKDYAAGADEKDRWSRVSD